RGMGRRVRGVPARVRPRAADGVARHAAVAGRRAVRRAGRATLTGLVARRRRRRRARARQQAAGARAAGVARGGDPPGGAATRAALALAVGGGGLAVLVVGSPSLLYQALEGWPQLRMGQALCETNADEVRVLVLPFLALLLGPLLVPVDRKSTRLNSSHVKISYAVFCLKKKNNDKVDS